MLFLLLGAPQQPPPASSRATSALPPRRWNSKGVLLPDLPPYCVYNDAGTKAQIAWGKKGGQLSDKG